jgi:hypothetical protein
MATKIASSKISDLRVLNVNSEALNRKLTLKLMSQQKREGDAIWQEKQKALYPNLLQVSSPQDLALIITDENQRAINDESQNYQTAFKHLLTVADDNNANYILDHLNYDEIEYMNSKFSYLVSQMRDQFLKMDKNVFINFIKNAFKTDTQDVEQGAYASFDTSAPTLSETGTRKAEQKAQIRAQMLAEAVAQREQQIQQAALLVHNARQQQLVRDLNTRRLAQESQRATQLREDVIGELVQKQTPKRLTRVQRSMDREALKDRIVDEAQRRESRKEMSAEQKRNMRILRGMDDYETPVKNRRGRPKKVKEVVLDFTGDNQGKRAFHGKGADGGTEPVKNKHFFDRVFINLRKLHENMLVVKYTKNGASLPSLKNERLTNDAKAVIFDICNSTFNERLYDKLSDTDKRIVRRFMKAVKLNVNDYIPNDTSDADFQKKYEILLGEYNSGNDAPEIKRDLKAFVVHALNDNLLSRHQAYTLLYELSL